MKLTFLGTRGYIEAVSDAHRMHTSTLVTYRGRSIRLDCGEDWLGHCDEVRAQAIFITHCHPDHAWGLKQGTDLPVYATAESWEQMRSWPVAKQHTIAEREVVTLGRIAVQAFRVQHSTRCPAVGYRITAGAATIFYAPDVIYILDREAALCGCDVYVGDGATLDRNFVRRQKDTGELIGHTPVRTQLTWCQKLGVLRMIVTHCGTQIVRGGAEAERKLQEYAAERGVRAQIATDGLEVVLP